MEMFGCTASPIWVASGNGTEILNSDIHDNADGVYVYGSNPVIQGNRISGSPGHGLAIYATTATVLDNVISNSASKCLYLDRSADDVSVIGNLLFGCEGGIGFSNLTNATVWYNTVVDNLNNGVSVGQATGVDMRNNIVTHSGQYGVVGTSNKFVNFDYNLLWANTLGNCNGCTPGPNSVTGQDPLYNNMATDDYSLDPSSPAVDAGFDTGPDRNGGSTGNFNGSAPDLGFLETN